MVKIRIEKGKNNGRIYINHKITDDVAGFKSAKPDVIQH